MIAELYRDNSNDWRVRLIANNGRVLFITGEGYKRAAGARNALEAVMDAVATGRVRMKRGARYKLPEIYWEEQRRNQQKKTKRTKRTKKGH